MTHDADDAHEPPLCSSSVTVTIIHRAFTLYIGADIDGSAVKYYTPRDFKRLEKVVDRMARWVF